jgi:hypothetical protein
MARRHLAPSRPTCSSFLITTHQRRQLQIGQISSLATFHSTYDGARISLNYQGYQLEIWSVRGRKGVCGWCLPQLTSL